VIIGRLAPARYEATATLQVQASSGSVVSLLLSGSAEPVSTADLVDVSGLVASRDVLSRVAERLGNGILWTDLSAQVSAEPVPSSHLVTLTATATDPRQASTLAEYTAEAVAAVQKAQVTAALAAVPAPTAADRTDLQTRAALLAGNLNPIRLLGGAPPQQVVSAATTPAALAVVGLAVGALVVIGVGMRGGFDARPNRRRRGTTVMLPAAERPRPESIDDPTTARPGRSRDLVP
jgi:hypothetical protein